MSRHLKGAGPAQQINPWTKSESLSSTRINTMAEADPTVFKTMLVGGPYQASDEHVQYQAQVGRDKVQAINEEKDGKRRMELFKKWANLGERGNCYVALPFFCEYVS
jgi:hypothetical protein